MAYNNSIRKRNKPLSRNLYAPGGVLKIGEVPKGSTDFSLGYTPSASQVSPYISKSSIPNINNIDLQSSIKAPSGLSKLTSSIGSAIGGMGGGVNGLFTAAGQMVGSALAGGKSSKVGDAISGAAKYISMIPGPIGKFGGAAAGIIGGGINALAGAKFNDENIAAMESAIENQENFEANASSFDTLSSLISTTGDVASNFSDDYIGSQGVFSNAVTNKADSLRAAAALANTKKDLAILNNAENIRDDQLGSLLASSFALGGFLSTNGADFPLGLTSINNGGSHESNPYEGVPMGVDNEGTPNLVEEGETIYNDYVFSKRLMVPEKFRKKYKLGNAISFADASIKLAKESEERPNDPISKAGLDAFMSDLANEQEALKAKNGNNQYANGGKVNKFAEGGYDWNPFLAALNGYTSSRIAGNTAGKYRPDTFIPIEGNPYMLGATDIAGLEKSPEYIAFTDAMIANPNLDYLRTLDAGVAKGVPTLFDGDNLKSNWADLYKARRYDQKGGIYHWTPTLAANNAVQAQPTVTLTAKTPIKQEPVSRYYYNTGTEDKPNYVLLEGQDNPSLWMKNNKYFYNSTDTNGNITNYYYDPKQDIDLGRNKLEPLRYAPAVGFGISALTDMLGVTNKPDYSSADAILGATRGSGTYQPVRFKPIGNYMRYNPFDRDYYTNKLNAESGAARRAALQTAGLNRGAGMAAILAADYNAQNQLGNLARQASEYNNAQRQQVEEFNRGTNMTNSQGFLQADMANQQALASMRDFNLRGTLAAAQMRDAERRAADERRSLNLSGFFQTLADIGYEAKNDNMVRRTLETSMWSPGAERVYKGSKGGKLRKVKRGLTF